VSEVQRIANQLKGSFEGRAWHGPSLGELLTGVTAGQASAKPLPGAHSIWEIVLHIAAWNDAVRRRLEGEKVELSPDEDWPSVKETTEAAWKNALADLQNAHRQLQRAVLRLEDSGLEDTVPGQSYAMYFMLLALMGTARSLLRETCFRIDAASHA